METRKSSENIYDDQERLPSLVSPEIAAVLSAIIPGLGQMLGREVKRGITLLLSTVSILGLLIWRVYQTARYDVGFFAKLVKSFRLQPVVLILTILFIVLWIWIISDAYRIAKQDKQITLGILFLVLFMFFLLGWQIGKIKPADLISNASDSAPLIKQVLWPWEAAIHEPKEIITTSIKIQIPCTDELPINIIPDEGAYITADPPCGSVAELGGASGTTIKIYAYGLLPNTETHLYWLDQLKNDFRQRQGGEYISGFSDENGEFEFEIIMPYALIPVGHLTQGFVIWDFQTRQIASVGEKEISAELKIITEKIIETIFIGMMATFFGIILAIPVSFLAARNLMSANKVTLAIYYVVRTILNIVRSIEPIIWALIFVIIVGLGPFAGIMALTLHSIAALGKLYSESIESIDRGQIEAVQATGANWIQTVMFAVIPQIIPPFVSFTIYRWDINIRMSTIVGMVGGGGIGFLLIQWVRLFEYRAAGLAVWFITVVVAILDYVSADIRKKYI